ncbi:MAG: hypothetical protein H0W50_08690 [Parachlamydiaceae bacterium]|nr:hypothetical protein [Parachlamydiaceae bacterium]
MLEATQVYKTVDYSINASSSHTASNDYLSVISPEIQCLIFNFLYCNDLKYLSCTSKNIAIWAQITMPKRTYDYLEELIEKIFKQTFNPADMERYNLLALNFKNFEPKSIERCNAIRNAISSLYQKMGPSTVFAQSDSYCFYEDKELFIKIFQNLDYPKEYGQFIGKPKASICIKTMYAYLSMVKENHLSPKMLRLELYSPLDKSITKYVKNILKCNTSLNDIFLGFDNWNISKLKSILEKVENNNSIKKLVICKLEQEFKAGFADNKSNGIIFKKIETITRSILDKKFQIKVGSFGHSPLLKLVKIKET